MKRFFYKHFLRHFFLVESSLVPLHNLLSYTPRDYVLNSLFIKQQLNILSSAFHIEMEVLVSSTSIPSISIQDVLKLP